MKHFYRSIFSLCLILAFFPATTQAAGSGEGSLSFGFLNAQDTETDFVFGDFTWRKQHDAWGAELGMFGVVGRLHETYAAVTYKTTFGDLGIGFPRPAYDDFATSALTGVMPRLSLDSIGYIRSRATYGTMYHSEYLPYGLRFSAQTDAIAYAVSLHAVPGHSDVIAGGAMRWMDGSWRVDLAAEAVVGATSTDWNTKAQVMRNIGPGELGLGMFHAQANDQTALVEAFGRFDVGYETEVTGVVRKGEDTRVGFGLGVSKQIKSRWALQAGVFGRDTSDVSASGSLRLSF
jgi:hypothetical protein